MEKLKSNFIIHIYFSFHFIISINLLFISFFPYI